MSVLIAGIGNVFLGDDGFGVEVATRLAGVDLCDGVTAADYGIRGVHLAYDLLDRPVDALVLVDAVPLGEAPGTLAVLEADDVDGAAQLDAHAMNPQAVLAALRTLGGAVGRVLVVGCQPASLAPGMGLSAAVTAAVPDAVRLTAEVAAEEAGIRA